MQNENNSNKKVILEYLKIRKAILIIIALQISLYFLIGDIMLEKQLLTEFQEFSERRLSSQYNIENEKVWEEFYFSSCGDEFFRDAKELEEVIRSTNINRYPKSNSLYFDENVHHIIVQNVDYNKNPLEFYYENVNEKEEINLIHFRACRIQKIPFIKTKVEVLESFSTHTDFHSMVYNGQLVSYKVNYVWILFKWVRIGTEEKTL